MLKYAVFVFIIVVVIVVYIEIEWIGLNFLNQA